MESIAPQLQPVIDGQQEACEDTRQIKVGLAELRRNLEQQRDETVVTRGMVVRYTGERITWGAVQKQLRRTGQQVKVLDGEI